MIQNIKQFLNVVMSQNKSKPGVSINMYTSQSFGVSINTTDRAMLKVLCQCPRFHRQGCNHFLKRESPKCTHF